MKTLTEANPRMASGLYKVYRVYRDAFLWSVAAENVGARTFVAPTPRPTVAHGP